MPVVNNGAFFSQVEVDVPPRGVLERFDDRGAELVVSRTFTALSACGLRNESGMYRDAVAGIGSIEEVLAVTARWVTVVVADRTVPRGSVVLPSESFLDDVGVAASDLVIARVSAAINSVDSTLVDLFVDDARAAPDLGRLLEVVDEWIERSETDRLVPGVTVELPPVAVCDRLGDTVTSIVVERVTDALRQDRYPDERDLFEQHMATNPWGADAVEQARRWVTVRHTSVVAPGVTVELPDDSIVYSTTVDVRSLLRDRVHRALQTAGHGPEAVAFLADSQWWASGTGPPPSDAMTHLTEWVRIDDRSRTAPSPAADPTGTAKRANGVAATVEAVMWLLLAVGVIGGLVVATRTDPICDFAAAGCSFTDRYPLFGFGIGIAIGSAINCLMVIMVAVYIRARATSSIR